MARMDLVGWEAFRRLDRLAELRTSCQTVQFSSFDRTGGNDDGFYGTYSFLRKVPDGHVIAEHEGPGEISSIWFTRDNGVVTKTGRIKIELDGRTVVDASLQDVVDGKLGAPFVWPLVGNGEDCAGGVVIKVPMPYRRSMRVITQNNPYFYHVTYRRFADTSVVRPFDPKQAAQDVIDLLRAFGLRDPKPPRDGAVTMAVGIDVPAGTTRPLLEVAGPAEIVQLRLRLPQVVRAPRVTDDGRAFGAGGFSSFTVRVDPANGGVRLTRRHDPQIGQQRAELFVDGVRAGEWNSGPARGRGQWADEAIVIPAELASGSSTLRIENRFLSSALDFNEFCYDVHSEVNGRWVRTDVMDVGRDHPGEESAHDYRIVGQTWQGRRIFRYPVDPARLAASNAVLGDARLRIAFDRELTVDSPVGEFFGSGLGLHDVRTLMFAADATEAGCFTAWWPMPFAKRAVLELANGSSEAIAGGLLEVTAVADPSVPQGLAERESLGYFHATSRRGLTEPKRDWIFLDTAGRGVCYGVTHSMRGLIPSGNRRNYLEGDERVYVDGSRTPELYGTGTEDFYESGWYFRDGTTFGMPLAGNPAHVADGDGCRFDCTGAYRLMISDAVSFDTALRFGIEHGPVNNEPADYGSTVYWYGQRRYTMRQTDLLDLADQASRAGHSFHADGASSASLTSSFEGDDDDVPLTYQVTETAGPARFTVRVDGDNAGVRLVRISDQRNAYQRSRVIVNDQLVGIWLQPLGNTHSRWLQDSFEIPAKFTEGRTSIAITLEPLPGGPGWSATMYRVYSRVRPFEDTEAPGRVRSLVATGQRTNAIHLQWSEALDDVGVAHYEVIGTPAVKDVAADAAMAEVLGRTSSPAFRHTGLGAGQAWWYWVRAVDGAGNVGPLSKMAQARSGNDLELEAEALLPPVEATAPVEAQGSFADVRWSGEAQLFFLATKVGDFATVEFDLVTAGQYELWAVWTRARDYGVVRLSLDGQALGKPFDGYHAPEIVVGPEAGYGVVELKAGKHQLTLTVVGKNGSSSGFYAGLDKVRLATV